MVLIISVYVKRLGGEFTTTWNTHRLIDEGRLQGTHAIILLMRNRIVIGFAAARSGERQMRINRFCVQLSSRQEADFYAK